MAKGFLQSIINVEKWDRARWKGVYYIIDLSGSKIPVLALVFTDGVAGREIFREWLDRIGDVDRSEELRIAIIDGEIPGEDLGYSVHICSNPAHAIERAKSQGLQLGSDFIITTSRIHRMNPSPDSVNLPRFKDAYFQKGAYLIVPASLGSQGVQPHFDFGIVKREIHFRSIDEITKEDIDSLVLLSKRRDD